MRTKRAVLWIAVSSGAQAEDDQESLPEQARRLQELASKQGWQVVDTITELYQLDVVFYTARDEP